MARQLETIFALSSGQPPAGIGVVRISGPDAHAAAGRLAGTLPEPRRAALRQLRSSTGELLDEALVLRFDAPASATGEDLVELHCHGGRAVIGAVLVALDELDGLREARPGEFTRRALEHGRVDLTEAEGLADLLEAETEQQRRAALAVAGGALRRQVETWRSRLVSLSAQAEAAIDYVGDDETDMDLGGLHAAIEELAAEWRAWLARPAMELLRDGVRVVLAGPPNAGKSSLLNALVEHDRAIVSDVAGTTRDVIEVPVAFGGVPLVLVDTAGLHSSADAIERIGVGLAEREAASADILLWLGDASDCPVHSTKLLIHAQSDRRPNPRPGSVSLSAVTGAGLAELREIIATTARSLLPREGDLVLNRRQASLIGEAAEALLALPDDLVLMADSLRVAREALDRLTGRTGVEDVLDALFGRFCLGK
ncbi:tRNA uridine-5-carboxymethylaminomethyl(34) synthesis GTPase MnmE [Sphingomonas sp. BN140010]|uniref:tRNA modification GTPase MnmE n=1 Tax=Sphingomonas arvum TaxID=2992113 RepID=A0ABT3JFD3_9SPHN|nr:tRNA uridine-5-carboxymethylaminomethyl(34) synthesis GTPase MnmE [Sphingomonas sp. BN140010]MCW3797731.1 tRNA uridine-5-carboxymethylaminomethyl(34) synthesis GTPase MnmE [Sphingomonas sp. BN140010]